MTFIDSSINAPIFNRNKSKKLFTDKLFHRFKDIFQEVYEEKWKQKFEENSIWYASINCVGRLYVSLLSLLLKMVDSKTVFQVWASANWWHGSLCIKKWGRICLGLQKLWWRCSKWFTCSRCCNLFQLFGVAHINMVLVPLSECWGHCYILAIFSTSIFANGVFLRELFSNQYFFNCLAKSCFKLFIFDVD